MNLSGTNTRRKALFTEKIFRAVGKIERIKNMANRNIDSLYSDYKKYF